MIIEGDARYIPDLEFKVRIQQCFELLRKNASNEFGIIVNVVKKIKASHMSGADVANNTIDIARTTFDASAHWLASVLVHEACHMVQYMAGQECEGQKAEQECNTIQLRTLRLIGAPQNLITYMLAQDGNHGDVNGDGKIDEADYALRNW